MPLDVTTKVWVRWGAMGVCKIGHSLCQVLLNVQFKHGRTWTGDLGTFVPFVMLLFLFFF